MFQSRESDLGKYLWFVSLLEMTDPRYLNPFTSASLLPSLEAIKVVCHQFDLSGSISIFYFVHAVCIPNN